MADLAKTQTPVTARRRGSDNRDFTLPSRRNTEQPRLEVNAQITRPNNSGAEALMRILGVGDDFARQVAGDLVDKDVKKQTAAGAGAASAGLAVDEKRAKQSAAYRDSYYSVQAQKAAIELGTRVTAAVQDRLADENDPATIDDINEIIDTGFKAMALDESGQLRSFGSNKATLILAEGMAKVREGILGPAVETIRQREHARLIDDVVYVAVSEGLPEVSPALAPTGQGTIVPVDPDAALAGVPGVKAPVAPAKPAQAPLTGLPVQGRISNTMRQHEARGSKGLDIATPIGTPVMPRAGGRVIEVDAVGKGSSGKFIRVDHGGGIVSSYSHLSSVDVQTGDVIAAGSSVGKTGNTGKSSGPHLHYRVKVNGADVDPQTFGFEGATAPTGTADIDPSVTPVGAQPAARPSYTPTYDFESLMARVPSVIPRGEAKTAVLKALMVHAETQGKPELLRGIVMSRRKDGTFSLNPTEQQALIDRADQLEDQRRAQAKRQEAERHETNLDKLLTETINGRPPSDATVREWVNRGDLDPQQGFAIISHNEAERKQEAREARAEAREAQREEDAATDLYVSGLIAQRSAGLLAGSDPAEDLRRFQSGEFGVGRKAIARYNSLRAARASGLRQLEASPEVAGYTGMLDDTFKVKSGSGSSMLDRSMSTAVTQATRNAAFALFRSELGRGTPPAEAYQKTMQTYGKQADQEAALRARRAALQARQ